MPGTVFIKGMQQTISAIGDQAGTAVDATDDASAPAAVPAAPKTTVRPAGLTIADSPMLDPHLQKLVAVRRSGGTTTATASTIPGEVAVLARVSDLKAWESLSEVRPGLALPSTSAEGTIVTGRIPLARIEAVRSKPFVLSLKAAQDLRPALSASVPETRADPVSLGSGLLSRGGEGAVVGIIDYGCDFVHQNFRTAGGSRIEAIWHQGGVSSPGAPYDYGALYERAAIEAALRSATPYGALGYGPAKDTPESKGTHGTHVTDIAAGNGGGSGVPGFAPNATIIFVDVSSDDISWSGAQVVGTSFGDSVRLLEAVQFVFERAGNRPCVINISLGTNGGPHDGSTLVERGLDRLVEEKPNRAVVIAASNSYEDQIHASGTLAAGGSLDIEWNRPASTGWQDEIEIWYEGADRLAVELLMPDGSTLGVVEPGQNGEAHDAGRVVLLISNRLDDSNNHDNMIGIFVDDSLPTGTWTIRLMARQVTAGGRFDAWIERDDASQASFISNVDYGYTIGSISCGQKSIVVASYDAHKADTPLSWFSSAGPTRDGRQKPELAGPGHNVSAAHSRTTTGVVIKSGTSMAAPAVAGATALLLGEAAARGASLDVDAIRTLLIQNLRPHPSGAAWDARWGAGKLDVAASMAKLPPRAGGAPLAATATARGRKRSAAAAEASSKQRSRKGASAKKSPRGSKSGTKPG